MEESPNGSATMSAESVKLFVGQVPRHMMESQLLPIFQEAGNIQEVSIIKDKVTKASRGCCFVTCPSRQDADKAISLFHNKRTLPGASSPMQVKYADSELERIEHKLFIGMLPKTVSDAEVSALFSKFGNIKELQILRGPQQANKAGCAFLKFETRDQAVAALEALNGKHKMEGSSLPLVVKWADTEKERQARRAQKAQPQAPNTPGTDSVQQPSLFGAMPMGYMPPSSYNGYGYQAPGSYGLMQYPLPALSNQPGLHSMVAAINPTSTLPGSTHDLVAGMARSNFAAMQSAGYMNSAYPGVSGVQYPMGYQAPMIGHGTLPLGHGSVGPALVNTNSVAGNVKTSSGAQVEGPPGANLFIYHIPQEYGDFELSTAFSSFGRVISAKVFVDKATGVSKCFGFVSYDSPAAAQSAINVMNGFQLSGKKLKVQLKRDNKQSKPY
uniref:RRM domain-containing protein n=1 Tax=Araucaria cunninghamii TaxID=56994 RepID=A0A0D6QXE7_ARACU